MKGIITHIIEEDNIRTKKVCNMEYVNLYPAAKGQNVETLLIGRIMATFVNRENCSNFIEDDLSKILTIHKPIECQFTFTRQSQNFLVGHCDFAMTPLSINEIRIYDETSNGEMFKQALSKYGRDENAAKRLKDNQKLTFHYIAETVYQFCKERSISRMSFIVKDLRYDPIDVSPIKYSIFMKHKMNELFEKETFSALKN